ncbi:MAG: class I SAM-dependent methyltransferase [Gemmatimonadetes bacterium]|uniref:Class I SAM-dependent methyltransferase n=1 Tax=Candidatus Kutchimonas denitrificans TaxID=3056748 RepID=A0AAE4Z6U9_9BACT|nr:class I SAM-dependent methyltransferase [Gemmatimonadota bacterium]NIR74840.1 class I SAM-dependent methyltransferase [Candidatus Kutchimonas denitrificans]NIR99951.1 class I SAM-dependent methyltransferase [Gemmatimonadota bacterium]NIT65535.1 class I SAM-dependent methyltransferase [Gemmatimonadota bacterium]NIU52505.1 methyltransferase domain-containing protein [Gemmatimonadota bacterium]
MNESSKPFWERAERVENFADREPDRRLLRLLEGYSTPGAVRVLDLGCAGGRNTVVLAERGFDFFALDASAAMVERTRERVSMIAGVAEAERRVRIGRMEDLRDFADRSFDLVVALGIFHTATSREMWDRALAESTRVLSEDGLMLVANFAPGTDPTGEGLTRAPGEAHVYEGADAGPLYLLESAELDAEMNRRGLAPIVASGTVVTPTDVGQRVTVNALYRKLPD